MNRFSAPAVFFALATLAILGREARAYLPPSDFILKTMVSKHAGYKSLRARSKVTAAGAEFKEVSHFDFATRTLISRAYDEAGHELYASERKGTELPLAVAVLMDPSLADVEHDLKESKIIHTEPLPPEGAANGETPREDGKESRAKKKAAPVSAAKPTPDPLADAMAEVAALPATSPPDRTLKSLARYNGSIAWVLGKKTAPSLWIEKDTYLPLRLLTSSADLSFFKYRYAQEFPFPRLITYVKDNATVLQATVTDVSMTSDLSEFKKPVQSGFTEAGNAAPGAVRDLIRHYYEAVR